MAKYKFLSFINVSVSYFHDLSRIALFSHSISQSSISFADIHCYSNSACFRRFVSTKNSFIPIYDQFKNIYHFFQIRLPVVSPTNFSFAITQFVFTSLFRLYISKPNFSTVIGICNIP